MLQGTDGNFYGTTSAGGSEGFGTIFVITPTGVLTLLHSFGGNDGKLPLGGLIQVPTAISTARLRRVGRSAAG